MICETRREEEGLLTVVGDRESWGQDKVYYGITISYKGTDKKTVFQDYNKSK